MRLGKVFLLLAAAAVVIVLAANMVTGQGKLTRENWVKQVCFPVDLSKAPAAGTTIDSSNLSQYAAIIPAGVQTLMKKYGFKIYTKDYEPIIPSDSYIEATNKYAGSAKLVENADPRKKGLEGYQAGLPFPNPQKDVEVAFNYSYSYIGDDADNTFGVYWIGKNSGIEKTEEWRWMYISRAVNRTDIAPMPAFDESLKSGTQYYSMTITQYPPDKKGFAAMYTRQIAPTDQKGWTFIPSQRKTMPMVFGTVGTSWNNTDLLYEDVRGYMGYPEWMNWKVLEKKTMLLPMNAGVQHGKKESAAQVYEFDKAPHWNFKCKWEPRPVYIVQATAKFKDYPYSKMIFYVDGETFYIAAKDAYDKKQQLWKVLINAWNKSKAPKTEPPVIGTSLVVDLQEEHATAFVWQSAKINVGLKPDQFTQASLGKIGGK